MEPDQRRRPDTEGTRLEGSCRECGYGIVVTGQAPPCPMCGSCDWAAQGRHTADSDGKELFRP